MPTFKQGLQDKRVISAVRAFSPGKFGSPDFLKQVEKFLVVTMDYDEARSVIERHSLGLADLMFLYVEMVRVLMPNPYIVAGGNMLAASLPFYEPFRLDAILTAIEADFAESDGSDVAREVIITEHATVSANAAWNSHTAARGEAKVPPPSAAGCGSVLLFGLLPCFALAPDLAALITAFTTRVLH